MTITLAYNDTLSRVDITATALAAADVALVERSTDQVRWTTVRGASAWPASGGVFVRTLHDYEFTPGVANYYRVRGVETAPITVIAGANSSGASGSRSPSMPVGVADGDIVLILASTRNNGTGTVDTPANWTLLLAGGGNNFALLARKKTAAWSTTPTITFTNGAANEDTIAQSCALRSASMTPVKTQTRSGGSQQNIPYDAFTMTGKPNGCLILLAGWKQDDWSSADALAGGFTEIAEASSTAGNDAAQAWYYQVQTSVADLPSGQITVTGGASAIDRALLLAFEHAPFLNEQTNSITPTLTSHWLKSVARPYLNMPVQVGPRRDHRYAARQTVLDIVDRTDPLAITSRRASAAFDLPVRTADAGEAQQLRNLLAGGDTLLVHCPAGSRYETAYVTVGDVARGILGFSPVEHWTLPCATTAAPESDVVGATTTCDVMLADFATCATAMAAFATCADAMEYIADPADVIVP